MCKCNADQRTVWYASVCAWLDKDGKALYAALFLYFHIAFTYAITHDSCTFVFTSRWYREGEILPELSWSFIYERSRSIITFPLHWFMRFSFSQTWHCEILGDCKYPWRRANTREKNNTVHQEKNIFDRKSSATRKIFFARDIIPIVCYSAQISKIDSPRCLSNERNSSTVSDPFFLKRFNFPTFPTIAYRYSFLFQRRSFTGCRWLESAIEKSRNNWQFFFFFERRFFKLITLLFKY